MPLPYVPVNNYVAVVQPYYFREGIPLSENYKKMRSSVLYLILLLFLLMKPIDAQGEELCSDCPWHGKAPYGDYCQSQKRGWYGSKKKVKDAKEAENIIKEFFSSYGDVKVTIVREKKFFFEAEIRDKMNNLIDIIIVDKRSGRIRSIY
jgi:hypothetical protein